MRKATPVVRMDGMRAWLRSIGAAVVALMLATWPMSAVNLDVHIREVMVGTNGASRAQFLVIEQEGSGQNLWGPQAGELHSRAILVFYDAGGRETGTFAFPSNPGTGGSLMTLVATEEFAALPGAPAPDVVIPALLSPVSGMVCFRANPLNPVSVRNECVAYGAFTGDTGTNIVAGSPVVAGSPAPALSTTNAVSLRRLTHTGRNADFLLNLTPSPVNLAGDTTVLQAEGLSAQGSRLFHEETFGGNGRTCATCHTAEDSFGLRPATVQRRFATVSGSYDTLFVAEQAPSSFDGGFDYGLNLLTLAAPVSGGAPCTGELRGMISDASGARAKVISRVSPTVYLVGGGLSPRLSGTVHDGVCAGVVASVTAGDLGAVPGASVAGLEDPRRMRTSRNVNFPQGRALFLENVDGVTNPPVFRKSPHLLNLRFTAPFGFSGDVPDLRTFSTGAVTQHFPRTLARSHTSVSPDFRLPSIDELQALEAFMLGQEFPAGNNPDKFNLDRFLVTAAQRRGRDAFFGNQAKCSRCHGGPVLAATTVAIQGKPIGVNAAFNTGVTQQAINGVNGDNLPCEPATPAVGACGAREFSVPQLFNVRNLTPLFHDNSAATVRDAVDFYDTQTFNNSPAGRAIGGINMPANVRRDITDFLEALVVPPAAPTFTVSPRGQQVVAGSTLVFEVEAPAATTFQWQVSSNQGTTWTGLTESAPYRGTTSPVLVVTPVRADMHGYRFRVVASNAAGSATSTVAGLTVFGPAAVNPAALRFSAVKAGESATLQSVTSAQTVDVSFDGASSGWTATTTTPWIALAGASGTGEGTLTVSVVNPGNVIGVATTLAGAVTLTPGRAGLSPVTLPVTLSVTAPTTLTAAPFGQVDTPVQNAAGVTGAIAVTGWALDDVGVRDVRIYRSCVATDLASNCQGVAGVNGVFVADAPFVQHARPDVEAAYPQVPDASRAGWGALVLSNLLPDVTSSLSSGGQGTLTLYVVATDLEGRETLLGRSTTDHTATTVTLANQSIAKPFGSLDTPAAGATVSGVVHNFGWALTPDTNTAFGDTDIDIPSDGRTVVVFIDGQPVSTVAYGQCRGSVGNPVAASVLCNDDVASAFGWQTPQALFAMRSSNPTRYRNLDAGRGAIGAFTFDSTRLSNGTHSIAWSVTDSAGRTEGIGSRFFQVQNAVTVAGRAAGVKTIDPSLAGRRRNTAGVTGRRGFDLTPPLAALAVDDEGIGRVSFAQTSRLELHLGSVSAGFLMVGGDVRDLPSGSHLDGSGVFTWAPGPGFLGTYRLVFPETDAQLMRVVDVTVTADQQAPGELRMHLDSPSVGERVNGAVHVAGWALDTAAFSGAGVSAVHVWATRVDRPAEPARFLGSASLHQARPDVAAVHGAQFTASGFVLDATLEPGTYDITAYVWVARTGRWEDARGARVVVSYNPRSPSP